MPDPADVPTHHTSGRREFFRHSGWLTVAAIGGGAVALVLHFLARKMTPAEYGLFGALMAVVMCIPAMPMQMVFTHQTASALATGRRRELAGLVRAYAGAAFLLWSVFAVVVLIFQKEIMVRWGTTNHVALWLLLPVMLLTLLVPVFTGLLQGQQNFFWLGWVTLISSGTRVAVAAVAVLVFAAGASGLMIGVLVGTAATVLVALWHTRLLWSGKAAPSNWRKVFRDALPLLVGFGAFQFLFSADPIFAKAYFAEEDVGFYASAGILSRALMWVVGPMAQVMFPRIVHSTALAQKTDILKVVLIGTSLLAVCGAIGLSLLGPWVVGFVYGSRYVEVATQLLPWYAGAMVPLTLANVLLNNLLAKGTWKIAPALCVLAGIYVLGLTQFHSSLIQLLQVFGASNLLLLATCAFYTYKSR
jgi:O-antigen/teichoic acid export membrane protein